MALSFLKQAREAYTSLQIELQGQYSVQRLQQLRDLPFRIAGHPLSMVLPLLRKAHEAYTSLQVELQGQYSVPRLQQLVQYGQATSPFVVVAIATLTPVPCILIVVLTDMIPLNPPAQGETLAYWTRLFISCATVSIANLGQLNHATESLRISPRQFGLISLLLTFMGCAIIWSYARIIGYPVPFAVQATAPWWFSNLAFSLWIIWRRQLRKNEDARIGLRQYAWQIAAIAVMQTLYPSLQYLFTIASANGKLVITGLLSIIKLGFRNMSSHGVYRLEDLAPVVVSFSVDVFHSLFLSCIMQGSNSNANLIVTMVVDVLQGCVSVFEVMQVMNQAASVETEIKTMEQANTDNNISANAKKLKPIQQAARILVERPHLPERFPSIALARHLRCLRTQSRPSLIHPMSVDSASLPARTIRSSRSNVAWTDASQLSHCDQLRAQYLQLVLKVLHMVEFYMLIEFTEVMVALIYSVYLAAMSHLPNRVYYQQLKSMTDGQLAKTLRNVLIYAGLELLSFVVLTVVLTQLLKFSTFRIMGFALQQQWLTVQLQLVYWVYVPIQLTLEHFGNDYTFQFQWLRHN